MFRQQFFKILLPGRKIVKIITCIPARYGSVRFPGKVLAKDTGKYLIQHVWEKARGAKLPDRVIIATDGKPVLEAAKSFGAECVLTSPDLQSGTDRVAAAVKDLNVDIVINLQGDEPEIKSEYIDVLAKLMLDNPDYQIGTIAAPFEDTSQISNPNIVKVITDSNGCAIYFSRSVIPYDRESAGVGKVEQYLRHLGIYAYKKDFLLKFTGLPQSRLEQIEKLEQLRAIENGIKIIVGIVESGTEGIDTAEQYAEFVKRYNKK